MKKIVFKFWIINLLTAILLCLFYRIILTEFDTTKCTFWENFLSVLEILFNLYLAFVYILAMLACSLTYFLNLIDNIRNNYFLSFLSFLGLPIICFLLIACAAAKDITNDGSTILGTIFAFSIIYVLFVGVSFLLFRKNIDQRNFTNSK